MYIFLLPLVIVTLLTLPVLSRIKHFSDGKKAQRAIIGNICTFFGIMILAVALPIGGFVSAEATAEAADVLTKCSRSRLPCSRPCSRSWLHRLRYRSCKRCSRCYRRSC